MACTSVVRGAGLNVSGCVQLNNFGDYTVNGVASFQRITFQGCQGDQLYLNGINQGNGWIFFPGAIVLSIDCDVDEKYDCLNGECVPKSQYNTPGEYSSLEECQAACGGSGCNPPNICAPPDYCPPGMVCIPSAQWGQIEGLSSDVKNNICG